MRHSRGFTLIELIMGIVILGIVAVISTQFVAQSSQGFRSTAERQKLAVAASVISEKLSREIREAVPNSIRVLTASSMNCLEFRPALAVTDYLDDSLAASVSAINAVGVGSAVSGQIAVYPIATGDLFNTGSPGAMTSANATLPAGNGAVAIALAGAHTFRDDSPSRRLYVVGEATAFCQSAGSDRLIRYSGYTPTSAVSGLPAALPSAGNQTVIAAGLDTGTSNRASFNYNVPTLTRNAVVTMKLVLLDSLSGERVRLSQEVQIRNVP